MVTEPLPLAFVCARFLFTLGLVFATYNPTGYSFFHWISATAAGPASLKAAVAVTLVMIYYAIFRVVFSAFRRSGLIMGGLAAFLFATELANIVAGWRSHPSWHFYFLLSQYVALCGIAIVLSLGVSWSHLIERLTGQLQKRYVRR
ncbi:MAG TPA: DUF6524 family protein [Stellaceae bacterium]|nr:DUF6524 family protein [Stellaceae bacterium]